MSLAALKPSGSQTPLDIDRRSVSLLKVTCLSSELTFLSSEVTFLSSELTFLSSEVTFLSSEVTFLSSESDISQYVRLWGPLVPRRQPSGLRRNTHPCKILHLPLNCHCNSGVNRPF